MMSIAIGLLGMIAEFWALWHAATAKTYEIGTYWFSCATYIAVWAVAIRQINSGQSLFDLRRTREKATPQ